jgi:hypothetical protein
MKPLLKVGGISRGAPAAPRAGLRAAEQTCIGATGRAPRGAVPGAAARWSTRACPRAWPGAPGRARWRRATRRTPRGPPRAVRAPWPSPPPPPHRAPSATPRRPPQAEPPPPTSPHRTPRAAPSRAAPPRRPRPRECPARQRSTSAGRAGSAGRRGAVSAGRRRRRGGTLACPPTGCRCSANGGAPAQCGLGRVGAGEPQGGAGRLVWLEGAHAADGRGVHAPEEPAGSVLLAGAGRRAGGVDRGLLAVRHRGPLRAAGNHPLVRLIELPWGPRAGVRGRRARAADAAVLGPRGDARTSRFRRRHIPRPPAPQVYMQGTAKCSADPLACGRCRGCRGSRMGCHWC